MTRFFTSLEDAVKMVWKGLKVMKGGEVYVLKNPSIKILDLARVIDKKPVKDIGIRPGEKINEVLISKEEAEYTFDCGSYYSVISPILNIRNRSNLKKFKKVSKNFEYISSKNKFLNNKEINKLLKNFKDQT